jgi:hypothetical protein
MNFLRIGLGLSIIITALALSAPPPARAHERSNLSPPGGDGEARGEVRLDDQELRVRAEDLPGGADVTLRIEGGDGALVDVLATETDGDGKLDLRLRPGSGLPEALGSLADLAGRRVEIAGEDGTVLLEGRAPGDSDRNELGVGRSALAPPAGASLPEASGRVRVKAQAGRQQIEVKVRGLEEDTVYTVCIVSPDGAVETLGQITTTGGGTGALKVDTDDGGALPFGATGVGALAGFAVRVKAEDGTVVLEGTVPALGADPDPDPEEAEVEFDLSRPEDGPEDEIRGDVKFEIESSSDQKVRVRIEDARPNAAYSVSFVAPPAEGGGAGEGSGTELFAELTTDADGKAEREVRGEQVFPFGARLLSELAGVGVEVRNADGALVLAGTTPAVGDPPVDDELPRLKLLAVLEQPEMPVVPGAHGEVEFEEEDDEHEIEVEVQDLVPGEAFQVLLLDGAGGSAVLAEGPADALGDIRVRHMFFAGEPLPLGAASFAAYEGLVVEVRNAAGELVLSGAVRVSEDGDGAGAGLGISFLMVGDYDAPFLRGDSNRSFGVDISDPIFTLEVLFSGRPSPACKDGMDANDDRVVDITDPIFTLLYLFAGRREPPRPGAAILGFDSSADKLSCSDD